MTRGPLYDEQIGTLRVTVETGDHIKNGKRIVLAVHKDYTHPRYIDTLTPSDARQLAQALTVAAARAEQAGVA